MHSARHTSEAVTATMAQLTAGAVNSMNNNQAAGIKPTLQLIDVKKIQPRFISYYA